MKRTLVLMIMLVLAVPAFGQAEEAKLPAVEELRERILRAIRLPQAAQESREEGVADDRVREVLETFRERRIPAGDAVEIFEVENAAVREGADKNNFGAIVQSLKETGLRGRELAEAIHAEQIARGMKKPGGKGKGKGKARQGGDR